MSPSPSRMTDLSMMTYIPLQPSWLMHLPAFQSPDASLVRACLNMLTAAFHGQPAGSLPDTVEAIATAAHLPLDAAIRHQSLLTQGWKKYRQRLIFVPMQEMAARLSQDYTQALARLQEATVLAIQAPDLFNSELLPEQGARLAQKVGAGTKACIEKLADTKIKRRLPEGAQITASLSSFLSRQGFSQALHEEIWQLFYDFQRSQQKTSASWESEFRNWTKNQIRFGKLKPCSGDVPAIFQKAMSDPVAPALAASSPRRIFSFSRPGQTHTTVAWGSQSRGESIEAQTQKKLEAAQLAVAAMNQVKGRQFHDGRAHG